VAFHLQRLGLDMEHEVVIVDRGPTTGGAWQFRWPALRLGSAHRVHDLPGMPEMGLRFDDADRGRPAKDVVVEYYRRYEEHYGLHVHRPVAVVAVRDVGGELLVTLRSPVGGEVEIRTELLVNATGTWGAPFVPWYPGRDSFRGRQVDTTEYRAAEDFANDDVIVVGGGTTAVGFLLELEGVARSTRWYTRRPVDWLEHGELDLEAATAAVAKQDEAARAGSALPSIVSGTGIPKTRRVRSGIDRGVLLRHPMFARIETDAVIDQDGTQHHADAILWATGFRPELRHLAPLRLRERAGGMLVGQGASGRDPRLFFAGYGPQASTIGANRAGRQIARQVVAALSTKPAATSRDGDA
jgi:hypothetical protein